MPISYWINENGYSQIRNRSDFEAIQESFRTWDNVSSADIQFNYRGTTTARSVSRDGQNIVTFADDSTPLGSSTIAATFSFFRVQGADLFFDEVDISFSSTLEFSTSGETNKFDIQGILTHEIGHLLGLDHSGLVSSVMVPFSQPSQVHQRTLTYDDIAGVNEIYPTGSAGTGQIRGFILSGVTPVFGAHVVAVDLNGTAWVSALSQPTGSYVLQFLPPGSYRVFAEPLDLPVTEQNVGGGSNSWYRNLTDFGTTYFPGVANLADARSIQVGAGNDVVADIQVLPKGTSGLNLTRPAFARRLSRGLTDTLTIGGEDVTAGTSFSASTPDVFLGQPTYGGRISAVASTSAVMDVSISASAALGPKSMTVTRGADTSVASGVFVIVERQPVLQSAFPSFGPSDGGTVVTITGNDFRAGARVYFAGLAASNVSVLDSTTIRATTPLSVPGSGNVQVINSDGTNGVLSQGYTYIPPTPTVTGWSPSSGPPTTSVTIEGTQFDIATQNVEVRFNGTAGRVVSATSTRIVAIVPYGATTGPVSVHVFGVPAIGVGVFEVTPATVSANRALDAYNFIDSAGGSKLTFQGPQPSDDGLATVQLPFNFSLFNDIYLAGSPLTVSTNGWASLEIVNDPYTYQNGRLPGVNAVDSSGNVRTIPPSLMAAFFDDLVMVPGVSSVGTRVLGVAPDRQLVIHWSRMSILDEDAHDLNANLNFEVILFEGSNDIQFVYQTMTGQRSNGSSATIGIQNLLRNDAALTGFNESKVGSGFYVTYRFNLGAYSVILGDSTPPSRPVVTDGGAVTASRTELFASWSAQDAESGVREYQYAIGRVAGSADIRPFTTTTQASAVVTGLNLDIGTTYYFAVRAVNNAGFIGDVGVSDGIRVEPTFRPEIKIVPSVPQSSAEFSGIALFAPVPISVVIKAIDGNGVLIGGAGVRNPVTVSLTAGQQYARLIQELFGIATFDGWVEIEASTPGLGVYFATGSWDMRQLDGSVARDAASDFVVLHPGANVVLVNPSAQSATVTISEIGGSGSRSLTIAPRSKTSTTVNAVSRIQSTEALSSIERFGSTGKLALGTPAAFSSAQASLVVPNVVTGAGSTTTLTLVNVASTAIDTTIAFAGASRTFRFEPGTTFRASLADYLQLPLNVRQSGTVRVSTAVSIFGSRDSLLAVVDVEDNAGLMSFGPRPPATDITFGHVAHGGGLLTSLSIASGDVAANVAIDVYPAGGGTPRSATLTLGPNQQISKLLSDLVPTVITQMGGYIRVRSSQPIWTWETFSSSQSMASGPPM